RSWHRSVVGKRGRVCCAHGFLLWLNAATCVSSITCDHTDQLLRPGIHDEAHGRFGLTGASTPGSDSARAGCDSITTAASTAPTAAPAARGEKPIWKPGTSAAPWA